MGSSVAEQRPVGTHFGVGQLKKQFGLLPAGELGFLRVQGLAGGFGQRAECGGVRGAGHGQGAVAAIAERGEQRQAGGAQPGRGERSERGGDVDGGVPGGQRQKGSRLAIIRDESTSSGNPLPRIKSEGEGFHRHRSSPQMAKRDALAARSLLEAFPLFC